MYRHNYIQSAIKIIFLCGILCALWHFYTAKKPGINRKKNEKLLFTRHQRDKEIIKFIQSKDFTGLNVAFWNDNNGFIYDLALSRIINPAVYPTKIAVIADDVQLQNYDIVFCNKRNDFQFEFLCKKNTFFHNYQIVHFDNFIICHKKNIPLLDTKLSSNSQKQEGNIRFIIITSICCMLGLYFSRNYWLRNNKIDIILIPTLLLSMIGFLSYIATTSKISNRAEAGIWFYKSKILYEEGPCELLKQSQTPHARLHAPNYPLLIPAISAVLNLGRDSYHPLSHRYVAITATAIALITAMFIVGSPWGCYFTALLIAVSAMPLTIVWGLAEPTFLALALITIYYCLRFLQKKSYRSCLYLCLSLLLLSLVKQEACFYAALILVATTIGNGYNKYLLVLISTLAAIVSWPLYCISCGIQGDFKIAAISWDWFCSIANHVIKSQCHLFSLKKMTHFAYWVALAMLLLTMLHWKKTTKITLLFTIVTIFYFIFFWVVFPFSKFGTTSNIVEWHIIVMNRICIVPIICLNLVLLYSILTNYISQKKTL